MQHYSVDTPSKKKPTVYAPSRPLSRREIVTSGALRPDSGPQRMSRALWCTGIHTQLRLATESQLHLPSLLETAEGQNRAPYSLRHTYATLELRPGVVEVHTLSRQMSNSADMIELHYSLRTVTRGLRLVCLVEAQSHSSS